MRTKDNDYLPRYNTNKKIRTKIDKLLEEHASLQATLGIDAKQKEIRAVVRKQLEIESKIKSIDKDYWETTFGIDK